MTADLPVTFSVVIATLDRADLLRVALESLERCEPSPTEVIVVDGDPRRSAEPVVRELCGRGTLVVRYVSSERGLTRQRNRALTECRGDVVAFFDDDATVSSDLLRHLGLAYADPEVVGVTGLVIEPDDRRFGRKDSRLRRLLPGGGAEGSFTRCGYPRRITRVDLERDVEFMQGCFMTARIHAAQQVKFDEHLTGYGLAEDEDFSCRLSRLGRIRYLPAAVVHHANAGFSSRDRRRFGRQVIVTRYYLFRKNFEQSWLATAQFGLMFVILVAHRAVNRDWRGILGLAEGAKEILTNARVIG